MMKKLNRKKVLFLTFCCTFVLETAPYTKMQVNAKEIPNTVSENSVSENNIADSEALEVIADMEDEIDELLVEDASDEILDKIEEKIADVILILSNEKTIYKDQKLKDLSQETITKIEQAFIRMDLKITQKYPTKYPKYKQKIIDTYPKVKNWFTEKYHFLTENLNDLAEEKLGKDTVDDTKKSFQEGLEDMKETGNKVLSKIKSWARNHQ